MKLKNLLAGCLVLVFSTGFDAFCAGAETYPWLQAGNYGTGESIGERIPAPEGYKRIQAPKGSFGAWLQRLPLRSEGVPVRLYPVSSGQTKTPSHIHHAVVDMDVLKFQQCADAIIRLRAEYLWSLGQADRICFNFTSGDACCWKDWKEGLRPVVRGNKVRWKKSGKKVSTRSEFMKYLDKVMEYAGSASLQKELVRISPSQLTIGDVMIQGGYPGHAVLAIDAAENQRGDRVMLLGQSFMPSQEFHVLRNPADTASPWFKIKNTGSLETPEWTFDLKKDCRRFGTME